MFFLTHIWKSRFKKIDGKTLPFLLPEFGRSHAGFFSQSDKELVCISADGNIFFEFVLMYLPEMSCLLILTFPTAGRPEEPIVQEEDVNLIALFHFLFAKK